MISPEQMRMLHATGRAAGRNHDDIRDEAAALFGITSLKNLDSKRATLMIKCYLAEIEPPAVPAPAPVTRFHFGALPKRIAAKPGPEQTKAPPAPSPVTAAASADPAVPVKPKRRRMPYVSEELDNIPF